MKLSCKTQEFLRALTLVSRAISGQQALPILGNILLEAEGKMCTVSATDLELSIVTTFEASIENEGAITIPAKAILNFAQYNSDDEVLLETSEGTQLKCTSKHAKTLIAGEAAGEYPTISPIEKKETTFSLETGPLLEALHLVTFATAKTTLRPVLGGVYFRTTKGELILAATDSYRLSEYKIPTKNTETDVSCIVPAKVLEELKSILGKGDDKKDGDGTKTKKPPASTVELSLNNQQIELRVGQTQLLSRLIDGKFPNYEQIIPRDTKTTTTLSTKDLTTTVKRMHYFAKETNNNLTFSVKNGEMHVTTPQTQSGKDEATLSVTVEGEENKIAISSAYLLDFLAHADGTEVQVRLSDSMHPAVFHIPSKDNFLHLIMPLRIQED